MLEEILSRISKKYYPSITVVASLSIIGITSLGLGALYAWTKDQNITRQEMHAFIQSIDTLLRDSLFHSNQQIDFDTATYIHSEELREIGAAALYDRITNTIHVAIHGSPVEINKYNIVHEHAHRFFEQLSHADKVAFRKKANAWRVNQQAEESKENTLFFDALNAFLEQYRNNPAYTLEEVEGTETFALIAGLAYFHRRNNSQPLNQLIPDELKEFYEGFFSDSALHHTN